jgi:hypothetical protein
MIFFGLILFVIFLALSIVHMYWGLGGKWKINEAVPTNAKGDSVLKPGPAACFVVAAGLLGFAIFVLYYAKIINIALPSWISVYGLRIIAAIFILRAVGDFKYVGFFKKIQDTTFAKNDSGIYSPLCLTIGVLCICLHVLR